MTAHAGIVGRGSGTDQGVVMTVYTAGAADGYDGAMVSCCRRMQGLPGAGMAVGTIAATDWYTWLQCRNSRMTEGAIPEMGDSNRRIRGSARIVTGHAEAGPSVT